MKVLLTGGTGMVGGLALRESLRRPEVTSITSIGRRPTGVEDPRLTEVVHQDFTDFDPIADRFEHCDVALFCLGVYTGAVSEREMREITVNYTVAFAETLYGRSPGAAICFLSGQGADPTGGSRIAFARHKGEAETVLLGRGFPRVHIFRPGYIYPVEPRREPNFGYRIFRWLYPAVRHLYPNIGIRSDDLARAMVDAGLHGTPTHPSAILENRDIRRFADRGGAFDGRTAG